MGGVNRFIQEVRRVRAFKNRAAQARPLQKTGPRKRAYFKKKLNDCAARERLRGRQRTASVSVSKRSTKYRPILRVSVAATTVDTTRPKAPARGAANGQCRRRRRREPGRSCAAHQAEHDRTHLVALERDAVKIAQDLHHPQIDGGDACDIHSGHRHQSAETRIHLVTIDDPESLAQSPLRLHLATAAATTRNESFAGAAATAARSRPRPAPVPLASWALPSPIAGAAPRCRLHPE